MLGKDKPCLVQALPRLWAASDMTFASSMTCAVDVDSVESLAVIAL